MYYHLSLKKNFAYYHNNLINKDQMAYALLMNLKL